VMRMSSSSQARSWRLMLLEDPRIAISITREEYRFGALTFRGRSGVGHLVFALGMFSVFRSFAVVLHFYFLALWPPPVRKGRSCVGLCSLVERDLVCGRRGGGSSR
jgi:hypothetical protein